MKDDAPTVVKCRLFVDGKVVEFELPGPLVTMRAAGAKIGKGEGGKRDGR